MAKKVVLISFEGTDPSLFPIVWQVFLLPRAEGDKPFFETTITAAGVIEYPFKKNLSVETIISYGDGTITKANRFGQVFVKGPFSPPEKRGRVIVTLP